MRSPLSVRVRSLAALALVLTLTIPLGTMPADARIGGGFSFGARGARSFSVPPSTATAPRWAQPLPQTGSPGAGFGQGFTPRPRGFGFGTGLAAGLLGAGLFGMLTGGAFFGGLGSLASVFGLLLQIGLVVGLVRLALRFWANRSAGPAFAGRAGYGAGRLPLDGLVRQGGGGPAPIDIGPSDFAAFERALGDIQAAHSREDLAALARLATPDMVQRFGQDIGRNRAKGLRNDVTGVTLLKGDLSEAWREGATDYATVAMRFGARDVMVERASGRVVDGDPARPIEATELWTFRRDRGGPWALSAIQQAA